MDISSYYNGMGIAHLERGSHEDALRMFKQAAQMMHGVNERAVEKGKEKDESRDKVEVDDRIGSSALFPKKKRKEHEKKSEIRISSDPANPFIYAVPIHFTNKRDAVDECTLEASAILFNMALAYHTSALSPRPLVEAIQNASTLYEMSYNLTIRGPDNEHAQRNAMASINNLGQLHHMMGDLNKCQEYFKYLSAFIMKLAPPANETVAIERQEFLLNAWILANPYCTAAAA